MISRLCFSSLIYDAPNPPSSPALAALKPNFFFNNFKSDAYTSQPSLIDYLKDSALVEKIINSCILRLFPAWAPPLIILSEGTGITNLLVGFPASTAMY
jgi:hypothetical protein